MADLLTRLTKLRQAFTDLLDAFEASSSTGWSASAEQAWRRVESNLGVLTGLEALAKAVPPEGRRRLEREIRALQRLRALLYDRAAREQRCVRHLLERVHAARDVLASQKQTLELGHSIDLAG